MTENQIGSGSNCPLKVRRARRDGWTKLARRTFLATLAETCNVRQAAAACGIAVTNAYTLRKRDPEFAGLWAEAMAIGYDRLEEALLRHAISSINAIAVGEYCDEIKAEGLPPKAKPDAGSPPRPGSGLRADRLSASEVQAALAILNRHRAGVEGRNRAIRGKRRATPEETDAALCRQLDMLACKIAQDEAREAAAAAAADPAGSPAKAGEA